MTIPTIGETLAQVRAAIIYEDLLYEYEGKQCGEPGCTGLLGVEVGGWTASITCSNPTCGWVKEVDLAPDDEAEVRY